MEGLQQPALPPKRQFVRNSILAALSAADLAAIGEFLEPTILRERAILQEPRKSVEHVYFVDSGIVSLRIVAAGSILETAVVGHRGALGASFLLGGHVPTHQSVVLFPGKALRIRTDDLRRIMNERPHIHEQVLRHVEALILHCAQSGLCGVRHNLEQRLACWLCVTCDALGQKVLPITHGYLSAVLGLHRASLTRTLIRFEEQGLIRKMRGLLHVDDHNRLGERACCCYGIISHSYALAERQMGVEKWKRLADQTY